MIAYNAIDLTGQRFGKLLVIKRGETRISRGGHYAAYWLCRCDCKKEKLVMRGSLKSGAVKSCGCDRRGGGGRLSVHGHRSAYRNGIPIPSRTYTSWKSMKSRCLCKSYKSYLYYGARGIKVCDRWLGKHGFENFLADMGDRPLNKTLDRFPNCRGNYEPGNCRWATLKEQANNTTRCINPEIKTEIRRLRTHGHTLLKIVDLTGVSYKTVWDCTRGIGKTKAHTTPGVRLRICQLRAQGQTYDKISRTVGFAASAVRQIALKEAA